MQILIFGKNGQVGRCLAEEAAAHHAVSALDRAAVDLCISGAARAAIERLRPDLIVNAAAYTAVDQAENDEDAARRLNCEAPAEMAEAAQKIGALFFHLSTDYVFDGKSEDSYAEDDETAPLNIYGATKRDGERQVLDINPQTIILRTSWVFSEFGANFVKTMLGLAKERKELRIVDDQIGGPTPARDIAAALLHIAEKKHRGAPGEGVYHYQGSPAVSWADFAREIFTLAGANVDVSPITSAERPSLAARPLYTVLDCARIERDFGVAPPDWRIALTRVINALNEKDRA